MIFSFLFLDSDYLFVFVFTQQVMCSKEEMTNKRMPSSSSSRLS